MGPDYMSLRRGDSVRDIGEVEEGWAFGEVIDARGNFIQKGWYPPDYMCMHSSFKLRQRIGIPLVMAMIICP
jgi:hypothetical protein